MIVVTGASGQLGVALQRRLGADAVMLSRTDLDLADLASIPRVISAVRPSVLINAAAYTDVDAAEADEELATTINGDAVGLLAGAAAASGARFVTVSTDYVFDGVKEGAYVESDTTSPINAYGRSKRAGEQAALEANEDTLVIRTSWLMSGTHRNFAATILRLSQKKTLTVVDDQFGRPTYAGDLAAGVLDAASAGVTGVLHLANSGMTTWFRLARELVAVSGGDVERIEPCATSDYPTTAIRPANSVLDSERMRALGLAELPDYHDGLKPLVAELGYAG